MQIISPTNQLAWYVCPILIKSFYLAPFVRTKEDDFQYRMAIRGLGFKQRYIKLLYGMMKAVNVWRWLPWGSTRVRRQCSFNLVDFMRNSHVIDMYISTISIWHPHTADIEVNPFEGQIQPTSSSTPSQRLINEKPKERPRAPPNSATKDSQEETWPLKGNLFGLNQRVLPSQPEHR